jgi:hypothetical protein
MKYHDKKTLTCVKCGEVKTTDDFYYNRSRKCYMKSCKKCNDKRVAEWQKDKRSRNDISFILSRRATEIRRRCRHKGMDYSEGLSDILHKLWSKQGGKCFYTGVVMDCACDYHTNPHSMTVDRIDPTKGYIDGNICLCTSISNRMKQDMSMEYFIEMCNLIINYKPH